MFLRLGVAAGFVDKKQLQVLRLRWRKKRTCSAQDEVSFIYLAFARYLYVDSAQDAGTKGLGTRELSASKEVNQNGMRICELMGAGFKMAAVDRIGVVDGGELRQAGAQTGPAL